MNLNLYDNMGSLHERESAFSQQSFPDAVQNDLSRFPKQTPLGIAYVPYQQWGETYSADEAFCSGTFFPDLDFPFKKEVI